MARARSVSGLLAQRGFRDIDRSADIVQSWIARLSEEDDWVRGSARAVLDAAAWSPDPDGALEVLDRIIEATPGLLERLGANEGFRLRLAAVLGCGTGFHQHLINHCEAVDALAEEPGRRSAAQWRQAMVGSIGLPAAAAELDAAAVADSDRGDDLRLAYRTAVMQIAARDLTADDPMALLDEITAELADLADATVHALLCLARAEVDDHQDCRLAIIALGKCGAQELNYISDVDVLFIAEPVGDGDTDRAVTIATKLAGAVSRLASEHTAAGTIWQIDAALRPEGKAGPLVRTLSSHENYYRRWAKNWEFQAMLKARAMVGDLPLGEAFCDMVKPLVWQVASRENFVPEARAMRRRVIEQIPAKQADREVKLGAGGLRDVEFTVQLLQMVHGRADERIRTRATLVSLQQLIDCGYVNRSDGAAFAEAYRWERVLEHRTQLLRLRRTHLIPEPGPDLDRIARNLRLSSEGVLSAWRTRSRRVLGLHNRLYYSPLLEAVARIPGNEVRLTTEAARDRLAALGYDDPRSALGHIEALTRGVTRQAEIQRQLLPAMLGWIAEGASPDAGLLAFRQVSEALGKSPWYLRALRDEGATAQRLAALLTSGRYLVQLLQRAPQAVQLLTKTDNLRPLSPEQLRSDMRSAAALHKELPDKIDAIRALRRRELFRIGAGDALELLTLAEVGHGLSEVTSAVVDVALETVMADDPVDLAVIAMGRWGGSEMSYASDADALIVVADDAPVERATHVIGELRRGLSKSSGEPAVKLDLDLRPEGRDGPVVRTLGSFHSYYRRWGETWETQALLRAAHGAGNRELSDKFFQDIAEIRWPAELPGSAVQQIRRLKARMESERLPRGVNRKRHLKLGPGGLSDIEWTVQLIQLRHAHHEPTLRTPSTLPALEAAHAAGLIEAVDAEALADAWRLASRIRDRVMLVRAKDADLLPQDPRDLSAVSLLAGGADGASHLLEEYHSQAFSARRVVERLFWES